MVRVIVTDEDTGRSAEFLADRAVVVTSVESGDEADVRVCSAGKSRMECDELLDVARSAVDELDDRAVTESLHLGKRLAPSWRRRGRRSLRISTWLGPRRGWRR